MLVVAPWTGFWDRNFFAHTMPTLGAWMANSYVRGAVSGVGVITAIAGLRDLTLSFLGPPAPATGGAGPRTLEP